MRILAAQINPVIGDLEGNARKICEALDRARAGNADVVVFPELTLTGYPPEDLLLDESFIEACQAKLSEIAHSTKGLLAVVGAPRRNKTGQEKPLFNSAAIFQDGKLIGYHHKQLLPTYDVFDEMRFFEPGDSPSIWTHLGRRIAVTLCEDLWQHTHLACYTDYRTDPVEQLQEKEVDLILNLSSSPYYFRRKDTRLEVFSKAAAALQAPLIVCNQVGGNDQLVFDGHSMHFNEKGELLQMAKGFVECDLWADLDVHACPCTLKEDSTKDLYAALVLGVHDYFAKQGFRKALLGLSGGIDSALVACIAKDALGAENVQALALPSRFSSQGSYTDAEILADRLQIELRKISIEPLFESYLATLEPHFEKRKWDLTEENLQARIRGQILMAFSNKFGALLLNTSNKSEMAVGYSTLYGDMCGALGVLHDVTKTRVYELARYVNREREIIPESILQKAPSAELRENQKSADALPFDRLDLMIEDYVEERLSCEAIAEKRQWPLAQVRELATRIQLAEYKRRQAPIGLRVTQKAFSKGRIVPIVQRWR